MTPEQTYFADMASLDDIVLEEKKKIVLDYVKSVTPYHKGDIIKSPKGSIKITALQTRFVSKGLPEIIYFGDVLNRHGEPRVDGEKLTIPLVDVIKI